MTSTRLPPELIDFIIDNLYYDKRSLAACGLVCKAWLPHTRHLLFTNVTLGLKKARDPGFLKFGPAVIPFIHHLHLDYRNPECSGFWDDKVPQLVGFECIKSLTLTFESWHSVDHEGRAALHGQFPNIVRLQINRICMEEFSHLAHFICGFTLLEMLIVDKPEWNICNTPTQPLRLPRNLRALALGSCDKDVVLGWLVSHENMPPLRSVYLTSLGGVAIENLARLLRAVGPSLEAFGCTADDGARYIDLSHNTQLRSVMVHACVTCAKWFTKMLSLIVSVDVEKISLTIYGRSWPGNLSPDKHGWDDVDAILAQPRFFKLRILEIFPIHDPSLDVRAWLMERLPQCHARGILRFVKSPLRIHSL